MKYFKVCFVTGFFTLLLTNAFSAERRETHKPWFMGKFGKPERIQTSRDSSFVKKENNTFFQSGDTLGTIMGTVTDTYGNPIKGVGFRVSNFIENSGYSSGSWKTDSLGHYTIHFFAGKPLEFTICKLQINNANSIGYISEWYDNKYNEGSANIITVVFPDTIKNIDFELEIGGSISGYVTSAKGPLKNVYINVYDAVIDDNSSYGYTDSMGYYIVKGLPTGSYNVHTSCWESGYIDEWYDNKLSRENANIVSVTVPDTTKNINFELEFGGCIAGYVTSAKGPLASVSVGVYNATTKGWVGNGGTTDSNGYYIATALPTGSYKVKAGHDSGYVTLYWNNKLDWNSAGLVNVTLPDTVNNINFSLYIGGKIKGSVYSAKGPIGNVEVDAFNINSGEVVGGEDTDSSGNYTIKSLPTGYYKLWAFPNIWGDNEDTIHAFEWYNNKNNWLSADSIYVTAPDSIINKDFTLEQCGFITGTVCGTPKTSITGAEVGGWLYINNFYGWLPFFVDETGTDGKYTLKNLRTGNYKVFAMASGYGTLWYNQKPDSNTANLVSVTMPNATPNIDFNLTGIEESAGLKDRIPKIKTTQNPFIRTTTISYQIPVKTKVLLKIYDITGRPVKTLVNSEKEAGSYDVSFNAMGLSSGIYFVRFAAGNYKSTKKLILMR
ncbi:MAG: T9SS type A sorting domain-containing protein [bacterium]